MKFVKLFPILVLFIATSCVSVKVASDYDSTTNFNEYKTYAFYQKGIDKAEIADFEKRRILKALEKELQAKGYTKSDNPDLLVNIFTKSTNKVNVRNNNLGWGAWGFWNPWIWGGPWGAWGPWGLGEDDIQITQTSQGTLFIDIIDAKKKELAWQGVGTGTMRFTNIEKNKNRIEEFVTEIMANYPPGTE